MPPDDTILEFASVSRDYATKDGVVQALRNVSLSIRKGECVGLLGPNGAGKTTLIKIIGGLITPTAGDVTFRGRKYPEASRSLRSQAGFLLVESRPIYQKLTVWNSIKFFATLYGVPKRKLHETIDYWLARLGLLERKHEYVENLSTSLQQRLALASVLCHDPGILILDEPTTGMDQNAMASFREIVREIHHSGKTVILCTHDLREAQELCTRMLFVKEGRLIREVMANELQSIQLNSTYVYVKGGGTQFGKTTDADPEHVSAGPRPPAARGGMGGHLTRVDDETVRFTFRGDLPFQDVLAEMRTIVDEKQIIDVVKHETTLEDMYFGLING